MSGKDISALGNKENLVKEIEAQEKGSMREPVIDKDLERYYQWLPKGTERRSLSKGSHRLGTMYMSHRYKNMENVGLIVAHPWEDDQGGPLFSLSPTSNRWVQTGILHNFLAHQVFPRKVTKDTKIPTVYCPLSISKSLGANFKY